MAEKRIVVDEFAKYTDKAILKKYKADRIEVIDGIKYAVRVIEEEPAVPDEVSSLVSDLLEEKKPASKPAPEPRIAYPADVPDDYYRLFLGSTYTNLSNEEILTHYWPNAYKGEIWIADDKTRHLYLPPDTPMTSALQRDIDQEEYWELSTARKQMHIPATSKPIPELPPCVFYAFQDEENKARRKAYSVQFLDGKDYSDGYMRALGITVIWKIA